MEIIKRIMFFDQLFRVKNSMWKEYLWLLIIPISLPKTSKNIRLENCKKYKIKYMSNSNVTHERFGPLKEMVSTSVCSKLLLTQ